jgi:hypothetical protein
VEELMEERVKDPVEGQVTEKMEERGEERPSGPRKLGRTSLRFRPGGRDCIFYHLAKQ